MRKISREEGLKKLTSRQEKFTLLLALGKSIDEAYFLSFKKEDREEALRLSNDPLIKKKLKELKEDKEERTDPHEMREKIIRELSCVAFADIKDFADILSQSENDEGEKTYVTKSLEDIPRDKRGAINQVTFNKNGTTIKLNDKFKAIELLEKELSVLEEKAEGYKEDEEIRLKIEIC